MNSPDIIKDALDALQQISDRGITVMQGWYDKNIHKTHPVLHQVSSQKWEKFRGKPYQLESTW